MLLSCLFALLTVLFWFLPELAVYRILTELLGGPGREAFLLRWGILAAAGSILYVLCYYAALSYSHIGAFRIGKVYRDELAEHLLRVPYGAVLRAGTGGVQNRIRDDVNKVQSFFAHVLPEIVIAALSPLLLVVFLVVIRWQYALALAAFLAVAFVFHRLSYSAASGGGRTMMELYLGALDRLHSACVEFVRGIPVARIFGRDSSPARAAAESIRDYSETCVPYTQIWEKYECVSAAMMMNLYLAVVAVAAFQLRGGTMPDRFLPDFLSFLVILPAVAVVIPKTEQIAHGFVEVGVAMDRLKELETIPAMENRAGGDSPAGHDLSFDHVSFRYAGDGFALEDLSFTLPEGSFTALVGPSGGGKSTVASLAAGFWSPDSGSIRLGGVPLEELPADVTGRELGFVLQDPFLFRQTVWENIAAGRTDVTREEIRQAAIRANAHDFIQRLPEGYDTVLSSGDGRLSGGERQRIAIARVFLQDPSVLILDEATSSTDPENEYEIQQALRRLAEGKTVLMICHRLVNVLGSDEVLVMDGGRIVQRGSHETLLAAEGLYRQMWDMYRANTRWHVGGKGGEDR